MKILPVMHIMNAIYLTIRRKGEGMIPLEKVLREIRWKQSE